MNLNHLPQQDDSPLQVLCKLIELFTSLGLINKKVKIKHQDQDYWIFCNEEKFLAYKINENCGISPGLPGWPVCIIREDYVFDESAVPELTFTNLKMHDWLSIIANQEFELI